MSRGYAKRVFRRFFLGLCWLVCSTTLFVWIDSYREYLSTGNVMDSSFGPHTRHGHGFRWGDEGDLFDCSDGCGWRQIDFVRGVLTIFDSRSMPADTPQGYATFDFLGFRFRSLASRTTWGTNLAGDATKTCITYIRTLELPLWSIVCLSLVPPVLTIPRRLRSRRRRQQGECIRCGYDLRGNVTGRCSECGSDITDQQRTAASSTALDALHDV